MNKLIIESLESLNRPGWTSMTNTGNLKAYNHKHSLYKGCFSLAINYYKKTRGLVSNDTKV